MRLLIFDDDEPTGRLVVRIAAAAGLEARAVTEPATFRKIVSDGPPRIILLDLQLGVTDAVEELRFLAEQRYSGSIILMSGFDARVLDSTAAVARNLDLNIVATLAKPIQIADLEEVIHRLRSVWQPLSTENLLAAIRNDELLLEFQPIVSWQERKLRKLEALVRWDHPDLGPISPADFVPIAESLPMVIDALTDWVVGAAIEAWKVLRELRADVPIAVNVSILNLHDRTLPDSLARKLAAAGMPAEALCLEITETAATRDVARMTDILTRMRLKGFQLAIDDFGTGYSSLKALRRLPFSIIKIDQSFIFDLTTSSDSRAIVKSIIDLAANMNMSTIAEGVETEAAAELLGQMNVNALQGYLIARPMPIEAIPSWFASWSRGEENGLTPPVGVTATNGPGGAGMIPQVAAQGCDRTGQLLSPRQTDVMRLLTEGRSVKEIARQLGLGIGTVKVHLTHAYSALGAHNRVEAIMRAGLFTVSTES